MLMGKTVCHRWTVDSEQGENVCVEGEVGEGMWVGGDVTCLPLQGLASVSEIGGWGRERGAGGSFGRCLCEINVFRLGVSPGERSEVGPDAAHHFLHRPVPTPVLAG